MTLTAQDLRVEAGAHLWDWFQPMWENLSKKQQAAWVATFAESYKKNYRPDQVNDLFRKKAFGSIRDLAKSGVKDVKSRYTPVHVLEVMASKPGWSKEKVVIETTKMFPLARYLRRADLTDANLGYLWKRFSDHSRAELLTNSAVTASDPIVADARRLLVKGGRHCVLAAPLFARGFVGGDDDADYVKRLLKVAARSTAAEQGERFARLVVTSQHITMQEVESFASLDIVKYARADADVYAGFDKLNHVEKSYIRGDKDSNYEWRMVDFPRLLPLAAHLFANPKLTAAQRTRLTSKVFDHIDGYREPALKKAWSIRHISPHTILLPSLVEAGLSDADLRLYYQKLTMGDGYSLLEEWYYQESSVIEDHLDAFPDATLDFLRDNCGEQDGVVLSLHEPDLTIEQVDAVLGRDGGDAVARWRWIADNVKFFSYALAAPCLEALEAKRARAEEEGEDDDTIDLETAERPHLMMVEEMTPAQAVKAVNDIVCWQQAQAAVKRVAEDMGVDADNIPREWLSLMA